MRVDSHMHTTLCKHAEGLPAEYVAAAAAQGLDEICFTDHCPMPADHSPAVRMDEDQLDDYRALVAAARTADAAVTVRYGIEAEYTPGYERYVEALLARDDFDFVLGSVHIGLPTYRALLGQPTGEDFCRAYLREIAAAARCGLFDSLAHPDAVNLVTDFMPDAFEPDIRRTLGVVKESNVCLEINTSGLRKSISRIHPHPTILAWAAEMEIPFTIGSDAHAPDQVALGFASTYELLRALGVDHVYRFVARQRIPVPMSVECHRAPALA